MIDDEMGFTRFRAGWFWAKGSCFNVSGVLGLTIDVRLAKSTERQPGAVGWPLNRLFRCAAFAAYVSR